MNNKRIIFIGGTGRCGTNILGKILSNNKKVFLLPQFRFMLDPDGVIDFITSFKHSWSPYLIDLKYKRLELLLNSFESSSINNIYLKLPNYLRKMVRKRFYGILPRYYSSNINQMCPNYSHIKKEFVSKLYDIIYSAKWVGKNNMNTSNMYYLSPRKQLSDVILNFYYALIEDTKNYEGQDYIVDNNTWNHLYFNDIVDLNQNFKLLHLARQSKDVICSFKQQAWMPNDLKQSSIIYKGLVDRWNEVSRELKDDDYLNISFEELIKNTRFNLEKICSFTGLDWDENMLNVDLKLANIDRWKIDLSKEESALIDSVLEN